MKKSIVSALAALALAGSAGAASAYEGGWFFRDNPGGYEILYLGDSDDNTFLYLRGTELRCGPSGASYARMRQVIGSNRDQVSWWIDRDCGDYVRVCVTGRQGRACSTYENWGWVNGRRDGSAPW